MCSDSVKCPLFGTYITPLHAAQLWSNYKKESMQRIKVAYNDAMRLKLRVPRWHSASQLIVHYCLSIKLNITCLKSANL